MNTHHGWDLTRREGETPDVTIQKRGAPSGSDDWEYLNMKFPPASNVRQWLQAPQDWKRRPQYNDEIGDGDASPVKRLRLTLSAECGGLECGRSDDTSLVC